MIFYIKQVIERILSPVVKVFEELYSFFVFLFFRKKLNNLSLDTQPFIIARHDYGAIVNYIYYAHLWQKEREKAAIFVLTRQLDFTLQITELIAPEIELYFFDNFFIRLINRFVRKSRYHFIILANAYSRLLTERKDFLFLWHHQPYFQGAKFLGEYVYAFDENKQYLKNKPIGFQKAYNHFIRHDFINHAAWKDYEALLFKNPSLVPSRVLIERYEDLSKILNITKPYVVLNLSQAFGIHTVMNRRRIFYPDRFNVLIDSLIEKGYQVIIQGRKEQPRFKNRPFLIDYARSSQCNPENDLLLFAFASFVVSSKTGPEAFAQVFGVPVLGVNYTEPASLTQRLIKHRFFYKHAFDKQEGKYLNWKEILNHPCFFEFGIDSFFSNPNVLQYEEMEEEEIIKAMEEFLPLINEPNDKWMHYLPSQKLFKEYLDPSHFELYRTPAVPCDCYLTSLKSGA